MQQYVAFLRGINLGKRRLAMGRLKGLFDELGFADVATFIASGNVLFSTKAKDAGRLEATISKHLEAALGYDVDTFVRTEAELAAVAQFEAFDAEARRGGAVNVGFLHDRLAPATARKLAAVRTEHDKLRVIGREYYWYSSVGVAKSEVWKLPEVKALRLPPSTVRNMNTVRKIVAKHIEPQM
jgi:uncharacterized protein (DUF1697 family)